MYCISANNTSIKTMLVPPVVREYGVSDIAALVSTSTETTIIPTMNTIKNHAPKILCLMYSIRLNLDSNSSFSDTSL